jgi:hypothetical protein
MADTGTAGNYYGMTASLRRWTANRDPHVRAAVELLIGQTTWLQNHDFAMACTTMSGDETFISWDKVRDFLHGPGAAGSSSAKALLRVAAAIGSDEFRLSRMDDEQAMAVVTAFADALAVEGIRRG